MYIRNFSLYVTIVTYDLGVVRSCSNGIVNEGSPLAKHQT